MSSSDNQATNDESNPVESGRYRYQYGEQRSNEHGQSQNDLGAEAKREVATGNLGDQVTHEVSGESNTPVDFNFKCLLMFSRHQKSPSGLLYLL